MFTALGEPPAQVRKGHAISLVCVDELKLLRDIEKLLGLEINKINLPGYDVDPLIKAEAIRNGGGRNNSGGRGNSGNRGNGGNRSNNGNRSNSGNSAGRSRGNGRAAGGGR